MFKVNVSMLEDEIIKKNMTKEAVASELGIDRSTFYRRLQSNRLLVCDIHRLTEVLGLSREKAVAIFFDLEVA